MSMHVPNKYRVRTGWYGTDDSIGNNGAFFVPNGIGPVLEARDVMAVLRGEPFDPARHRIKREIKAVTYHQASVTRTAARNRPGAV